MDAAWEGALQEHIEWLVVNSMVDKVDNKELQACIRTAAASNLPPAAHIMLNSEFATLARPGIIRKMQSRNDWDRVKSWVGYLIRESIRLNHEETVMLATYPDLLRHGDINLTFSAEAADIMLKGSVAMGVKLYKESGMVQKALEVCMQNGEL